jgi:DNA-3-methyladenine glycosylase I
VVAAVIARRCFGDGDPLFERYHDEEWGLPVLDERGLFERLTLEAFQSGLSWRTVLTKRDAFRAAFADFDPDAVARLGDADVQRLPTNCSTGPRKTVVSPPLPTRCSPPTTVGH